MSPLFTLFNLDSQFEFFTIIIIHVRTSMSGFSLTFLGGSSDAQHRSDSDTRGDIDRGLKRSRPRSPTENWSQNNNQVRVVD